jgi:hypothetical protein
MSHIRISPKFFRHLLAAPIIYSIMIPAVILHVWIEAYHRLAFPLYGIPYVKVSSHIKMDRGRLAYLAWYDKLNCMYCEYVNGLFAYAADIAARTEEYWCSIKHAPDPSFKEPAHHKDFIGYGDEAGYRELLRKNDRPGKDVSR